MPDEIELGPEDLGESAGRLGIKPADSNLVDNDEVNVKVLVAGVPAKATLDKSTGKVTVTPPPEIGDGPWTIVVTTKTDQVINILAYDPKEKNLHIPVDIIEDEDD
jgi:hypothetical protein